VVRIERRFLGWAQVRGAAGGGWLRQRDLVPLYAAGEREATT